MPKGNSCSQNNCVSVLRGVEPHFGQMKSGNTKKTCQLCCDRQKAYSKQPYSIEATAKKNAKKNAKNSAKTSAKLAATKKALELPVLGLTSGQYGSGIATRIQTSIIKISIKFSGLVCASTLELAATIASTL